MLIEAGITKAPSKLPAAQYPGAKTRYDDFVAIHIKNTLSIHGTVRTSLPHCNLTANTIQGNFLSWHRYFTFAYEQALIKECGYNGTQPVSLTSTFISGIKMLMSDNSTGTGAAGHLPQRPPRFSMEVKPA